MRSPVAAIETVDLTRIYSSTPPVRALGGVSLRLEPGTFTAIMGPSGSGKTTLLNCMAGLDTPTGGEVWVCGTGIGGMTTKELTQFRRRMVGFIFQAPNLLPTLNVADNVLLPAGLAGDRKGPSDVRNLLAQVGMANRAAHYPNQLSGGQQQRVVIARALMNNPPVIFADEPTAALDLRSGNEVLSLMRDTVAQHGKTIVMVTHNPSAAAYTDRALFLTDGQIAGEIQRPTAASVNQTLAQLTLQQ